MIYVHFEITASRQAPLKQTAEIVENYVLSSFNVSYSKVLLEVGLQWNDYKLQFILELHALCGLRVIHFHCAKN